MVREYRHLFPYLPLSHDAADVGLIFGKGGGLDRSVEASIARQLGRKWETRLLRLCLQIEEEFVQVRREWM